MKPILKSDFQNRTAIPNRLLCPAWGDAERVVSLREIVNVDSVAEMSNDYLVGLTNAITLVGDSTVFPYKKCKIQIGRTDTQHVRVGQSFVQSGKCMGIISAFPGFSEITLAAVA